MKFFKKPIAFVLTVMLVITSFTSLIVSGASAEENGPTVKLVNLAGTELTDTTDTTGMRAIADAKVDTVSGKATVKFDETSGAYEFIGWFVGDTCVGTDKTLTLDENNGSAVAKILSKNALTNGGSFENVDAGNLYVGADSGKTTEWGGKYYYPVDLNDTPNKWTAGYSNAYDYQGTISAVKTQDYAGDNNNISTTVIKPHSGDTMIKVGRLGTRTYIYSLKGLNPNQNYTLKFYTCAGHKSTYLQGVYVTNSYKDAEYVKNPAPATPATTLAKVLNLDDPSSGANQVYKIVWEGGEKCITSLVGQAASDTAWSTWAPVTINFKTDSTGVAYLHLFQNSNGKNGYFYIDDLTVVPQEVTEDVAVKVVNTKGEDVTNKTYSVKAQKIIDIYGNTKLKALNTSDEYKFLGWYKNGEKVKDYGANTEVNLEDRTFDVTNLEARFETTNVLTNGGSFENVAKGEITKVFNTNANKIEGVNRSECNSPADLKTNELYDNWTTSNSTVPDWGYHVYSAASDITSDNITITPHSGDKMIKMGMLGGRYAIYYLNGLKPNQKYTLKFYTHAGSESSYLNNALVSTSHLGSYIKKMNGSNVIAEGTLGTDLGSCSVIDTIYSHEWKDNSHCITGLKGQTNDANAWNSWVPVTIDFETDSTGDAYLHLQHSAKQVESKWVYYCYIDDLTCVPQEETEDVAVKVVNTKGKDVTANKTYSVKAQKIIDIYGNTKLKALNTSDEYKFLGWYDKSTGNLNSIYGTNEEYNLGEDRTFDVSNLEARFKTTNVLTNGGSFENLTSNGTIAVAKNSETGAVGSPFDAKQVDGKWVLYNLPTSLEGKPDNWTYTQDSEAPDWADKVSAVKTQDTASDGTIIKPHSGDTMIKLGNFGGRSYIYYLAGLSPNQSYSLKFYTCTGNKSAYLHSAYVTTGYKGAEYVNSPDDSNKTLAKAVNLDDYNGSFDGVEHKQIYIIEWVNSKPEVQSLSLNVATDTSWYAWAPVTLNFTTDETGVAYLHLKKCPNGTNGNFYIDDLTCEAYEPETMTGNKAAICSGSETRPNGLRIYNAIDKSRVSSSVDDQSKFVEFGSIVALKEENLNYDIASDTSNKRAVLGISYRKSAEGNIQTLWAETDSKYEFTSYLTGISEENYGKDYKICTYAKCYNGAVVYGETVSVSVFEVANAIDNNYSVSTTEANIAAFKYFVNDRTKVAYQKWCNENKTQTGPLFKVTYTSGN